MPASAIAARPRRRRRDLAARAGDDDRRRDARPRSRDRARDVARRARGPTLADGSALERRAARVLALGALGVGAEVASAALLGAVTGEVPAALGDPQAELAGRRGAELAGASALELLAHFGGPETAVLAGLILGAASINVPVILDSYATGAAALVAARLAPAVTGYLIAAHRGSFTMPAILRAPRARADLRCRARPRRGHRRGDGAPAGRSSGELANAS